MQATNSFAGDYHNQNSRRATPRAVTLACAQCHMMHGTQGGNSYSLIYTGGAPFIYPKLLRADSVVNLCKYCHEGDPYNIGAPVIFGPVYNASGGDFSVGSGNFDGACNGSPLLLTDGDKRHDIGCNVFSIPPPGFVATGFFDSDNVRNLGFWQNNVITRHGDGDGVFSCEYCHDQHGNTNYRNLRPTPYDPGDRVPGGLDQYSTPKAVVTYINNVYDGSASILQKVIDGDADGSDPANQYKTSNIEWRKHDDNSGNVIQIAGFCGKCHINFFGVGGDNNLGGSSSGDRPYPNSTPWRRHTVGGVAVGIGNGHTDPQDLSDFRVIDPDGLPNTGDEQPFCFTCHRVHGSTRHTNLIFGASTSVGGAGTSGKDSTGMMRDTCQQCHNQ